MKEIPTAKEPEQLKDAFFAKFSYSEIPDNDYDLAEYMLLNKAHEEKFGEDVGNINYEGRLHELNLEIRKALETGTAYDRGLPDGAIL